MFLLYKMNILIIIILGILFTLTLCLNPVEPFEKRNIDCVISINVHEKFPFLLKQLQNLKDNVSFSYAVILNCNEYMLNECKANVLPENVFYYEESLEKNRYHGSLSEGIYRNMIYAIQNFNFEYFIVVSSRSLFDNNLSLADLKRLEQNPSAQKGHYEQANYESWYWPNFSNTLLYKHYKENNLALHSSAHEGLVFTKRACEKIMQFLESKPEIKIDTFNFGGSVEEFALQTIAVNEGETFYYIGTGCCSYERINHLGPENSAFKFTYKVDREGNLAKNSFVYCRV